MNWRPDRAIEIIAGTPPGAGLDRTARALAHAIESQGLVDVPIKVLNMPGDRSRKIWAYLDRFPNDAHVLAVSSPNVTTDNLTGQTAFDHDTYTPLAILHNEYLAFVARADSPVRSSVQLMERLAADAGSLTVAVATSAGNPNHIALARVTRHVGGNVKALKVSAFDSARHAIADVVAGGCDIGADFRRQRGAGTRGRHTARARGIRAGPARTTFRRYADVGRARHRLRNRRLARRRRRARPRPRANRILGFGIGGGDRVRRVENRDRAASLERDVPR